MGLSAHWLVIGLVCGYKMASAETMDGTETYLSSL
jgi:hypothetical protein